MNVAEPYQQITDQERIRIAKVSSITSLAARHQSHPASALIDMLTDSSWVVRRAVVASLASLGEEATELLAEVLLSKRESEAQIAAAVDALVLTPTPIRDVVARLVRSADAAVVADAAQILGRRRSQSGVATLVELTRHADDNVAVGAIEALGKIGGRAAVEALIAAIHSGHFFRVFPAIDVLGKSGDPRAVAPLAALLKSPSYLPEAARALGKTGERAALGPLLTLLSGATDVTVRLAAVAIVELRSMLNEKTGADLAYFDHVIAEKIDSGTTESLIRGLLGADPVSATAICKLLGVARAQAAQACLVQALDSVPGVAASAAAALKEISRGDDDVLLKALRSGNSSRRLVLLPFLTQTSAATEVANCLTDPDPNVRALACETLARLGNGEVVTQVFPLLADSNLRIAQAATATIQALGTRVAHDLVVVTAQAESAAIRRNAIKIIAYFGDPQRATVLVSALGDPDPRVREAALVGLPHFDSPLACEALFSAAASPDARTRALAIRSLGALSNTNANFAKVKVYVRGAFSDADAWVRYYACQAAGRLKMSGASTELAKLIHDEAGQVRVAAVEALSHLATPDADLALIGAAHSEDLELRRAAIVGLGISHREENLPVVLSGATSADLPTRLIVLSALAAFASPLAMEVLQHATADTNEQVSATAIGFLGQRVESKATDVLVKLLKSPDKSSRARASLQKRLPERTADLLRALEQADDDLAPVLISILCKLERTALKIVLLSALQLGNRAARKAAATVLGAHADLEIVSALREAAQVDPDHEVREICVLVLSY